MIEVELMRQNRWTFTNLSHGTAGKVGALTALVGEELAVGVHHHFQVADLRGALHRELAWNLASIKDAADDLPCVEARLKEVEAWEASLQRPVSHQDDLVGHVL